MNANKGLITALLTALLAAPAWAQVYRWVDDKGTVNYSNEGPRPILSRPPSPWFAAA
jgi:hypothetical protein